MPWKVEKATNKKKRKLWPQVLSCQDRGTDETFFWGKHTLGGFLCKIFRSKYPKKYTCLPHTLLLPITIRAVLRIRIRLDPFQFRLSDPARKKKIRVRFSTKRINPEPCQNETDPKHCIRDNCFI